ncbi:hypothetical protein BV898_19874 [Hypsibius exemplaris]|uniref:Uncharacterized protein n=1 Tax=Hypsibius exemplaris TaxID=2072580 RepID=A0A9X6RPH8_HYPEX|nr:hypothetical protein BV898_19874 [Hypsibius exemplaris]
MLRQSCVKDIDPQLKIETADDDGYHVDYEYLEAVVGREEDGVQPRRFDLTTSKIRRLQKYCHLAGAKMLGCCGHVKEFIPHHQTICKKRSVKLQRHTFPTISDVIPLYLHFDSSSQGLYSPSDEDF